MIIIKSPSTRQDFKEYYALRHDVLHKGQPKGVEKDDFEPISTHLMAVDDVTGKIVGVVKMHEREPGIAQFSHLAVHADYRTRGIGKLLMDRLEDLARSQGYTTLGCYTHLEYSDLFKKFGYQVTELPAFPGGLKQTVWMEKPLLA